MFLGRYTCLLGFLFSCLYLTAFTHREEGEVEGHKIVVRPHTIADRSKGSSLFEITRDQLSGSVHLLTLSGGGVSHLHSNKTESNYRYEMRKFVQKHKYLLGVAHKDLRLVDDATHLSDDVAFFKFHVYRNDLRIEDASVLFRFKFGRLLQVVNYSFSEANLAHPQGNVLSNRQLLQVITEKLGENKYTPLGSFYRVRNTETGYELLLVRLFRQELGDKGLLVQIDGNTGEIYEIAPSKLHLRGRAEAKLYKRWYGEEASFFPLREVRLNMRGTIFPVVTNSDGYFNVSGDTPPTLQGMRGNSVTLFNRSGTTAAGNAVQAEELAQIRIGNTPDAQVANDKLVAQSMVYYHLDNIIRTASRYINPSWFNRPLIANSNISFITCNAFYDTWFSTVNFILGDTRCANSGLVADIIYHEWGHGLDAKTGGITDGAFSEGFGDILAMLMNKSPIIGKGFFLNSDKVIRELETDKIYPQDFSNKPKQIHIDGLIIGSTFWDMFKKFKGRYAEDEAIDILSRYAFKMIYTAERFTDVYDALLVIDDDDANLANGTPNFCLINTPFVQHGLASDSEGQCTQQDG